MTTAKSPVRGGIGELTVYFLRLGLLGFGGPVALVGQMERELVSERRWLTKEQMREAIAICQSLPGPLAIQVGIRFQIFAPRGEHMMVRDLMISAVVLTASAGGAVAQD